LNTEPKNENDVDVKEAIKFEDGVGDDELAKLEDDEE
jgi:hypothetical protein